MAKKPYSEGTVIYQIEHFIKKRTKKNKHYELQDIKDDLASWARDNPDVLEPATWASDRVNAYDQGKRPKPSEPGFFDEEGLIPVSYRQVAKDRIAGTGERCRYGDAGEMELIAWLTIETQQFTDQGAAHNRRVQEINFWLMAFRKPEYSGYKTIGELRDAMRPKPNGGSGTQDQPSPPA